MGLKDAQIGRLERSVQSLSAEKNNLFDQLQMRQAEVESAQSLLEVLQNQNTELQYQIREKDDRIALLHEELNDARQEQHAAVSDLSTSPEEVAKLLAAAESRHEAKLSLLKQELAAMEAERVEVEAEWRGKVEAKVQEAQKWKAMVDSASRSRQDDNGRTQELQAEVERLQSAARAYDHEVSQLRRQIERSTSDQVCIPIFSRIRVLNAAMRRKLPDNSYLNRSKRFPAWTNNWKKPRQRNSKPEHITRHVAVF